MALSPELQQFSSSGIYRLEFDKSQTAAIPAEQIRLVVGFSKKGPFNTPVFVPDPAFFQQVYGSVDRGLERKGSYFHRTALAALERGPILALNLLRLNNDIDSGQADLIDYQVFSSAITSLNPDEKDALYSGFFNKDKFWFPEDKSFLNNIGTNKDIFQLVNLSRKPISVIVRQATDVSEFDVIAKEWFGVGNVPDFMNENDYLSDYMINVIVIDGDFTDFPKLAIDPIFGQYFDAKKGLIKSEIDNFLDAKEITVLGNYTGSLIPDFIDLNGNNVFIQDIINFETSATGLFCAIDKDRFDDEFLSGTEDGIDIIGHNLENKTNVDPTFNRIKFFSYDRAIKDDLTYPTSATDVIGINVNTSEDISFDIPTDALAASQTPPVLSSGDLISPGSGAVNYNIRIGVNSHSEFLSKLDGNLFINTAGNSGRKVGSYVLMTDGSSFKWAPIVSLTENSGIFIIGLSVEEVGFSVHINPANDNIYFISAPDWMEHDATGGDGVFRGAKFNAFFDDFAEGIITSGDKVRDAAEPVSWFLKLSQLSWGSVSGQGLVTSGPGNGAEIIGPASYAIPVVLAEAFEDEDFVTQEDLPVPGPAAYLLSDGTTTSDDFAVQSLAGSLNVTIPINTTGTTNDNEALIESSDGGKVEVGDYLIAEATGPNGESRLTRILRIATEGSLLRITTDAAILKKSLLGGDTVIERYRKVESIIEHYKLFALNGFTLDANYHIPNGSQSRMDDILNDTIGSGTNLFKALADRDSITYRYIVDSWGLGIQNQSKSAITKLARSRQNVSAIMSAPSMADFKKSTDPSFIDVTGQLSTRLISTGGDLTKNPSQVYSLPSINNGANYSFFYTPYIIVRDRGKNIEVPPAGYVSNNFIDKFANALPWSIVAGPRRGVVSGRGVVGLEVNFTRDDRDNLEPFGLNPIIFQRGVGLMISGNKTAQQSVQSALSSAHVREVLIFIQDGIAEILKNYQWEFNTVQTRLEIVTLADNFLEGVQQDNGIFDFRNIMDETNNTNEIIDANMGVLDTFVEPVRGLEILVHRTTILRTGAISTGQFV